MVELSDEELQDIILALGDYAGSFNKRYRGHYYDLAKKVKSILERRDGQS